MEYDPKCFFEHPPRMVEDVKVFFKELASNIVKTFALTAITLGIETLTVSHVKLLMVQIANDNTIMYGENNKIRTQLQKVKSITKIVCKAIDNTDFFAKNGNMDKKIVKGVDAGLREYTLKANAQAKLSLSVVVSEVCGICIQSAASALQEKTLTMDVVNTKSFLYNSSQDGIVVNDSLFRFINNVMPDNTLPYPISSNRKKEVKTQHSLPIQNSKADIIHKKIESTSKDKPLVTSILKKNVQFADNCVSGRTCRLDCLYKGIRKVFFCYMCFCFFWFLF